MFKKGFSTILIVVIVLAVIAGGVLTWQHWQKDSEEKSQSETINIIANYMGSSRIKVHDDDRSKIGVQYLIITNDKDDSVWNTLEIYENLPYELLMFGGSYYVMDNNIGYIALDYVSNLDLEDE